MEINHLWAYEGEKELEFAGFLFPVCVLRWGFRAFLALKTLW